LRIVLDTNVLVSGLLSPFGPSAQIVRLVAVGEIVLCVDPRILAEYRAVLARPGFGFPPEAAGALIDEIEAAGELVVGRPLAQRPPDPDDEPFLEVALASGAEHVVTGNRRHYPASRRSGVSVVSPRELLARISR